MNSPLLKKDVEMQLARDWKDHGSRTAQAKLLAAYQPLIGAIAAQYMRPGLLRQDLVQEGNMGFLASLNNFDPSLGYSVGTLARFHIAARMQIYVSEFAGVLRLPNSRRIRKLLTKCIASINQVENETGEKLSDSQKEEIAKELGFSLQEIQEYERALRPAKSLSHAVGTDDEPGFEIAAENSTQDDQIRAQSIADAAGILAKILDAMPERTRSIIVLRHMNPDFVSLEQIAEGMNLSRERVRRIEIEALEELRRKLQDAGIESLSDIL